MWRYLRNEVTPREHVQTIEQLEPSVLIKYFHVLMPARKTGSEQTKVESYSIINIIVL